MIKTMYLIYFFYTINQVTGFNSNHNLNKPRIDVAKSLHEKNFDYEYTFQPEGRWIITDDYGNIIAFDLLKSKRQDFLEENIYDTFIFNFSRSLGHHYCGIKFIFDIDERMYLYNHEKKLSLKLKLTYGSLDHDHTFEAIDLDTNEKFTIKRLN